MGVLITASVSSKVFLMSNRAEEHGRCDFDTELYMILLRGNRAGQT